MERFFTGAQKNWSITELLSAHEGQIMQKAWHMAFTSNDLFDRDFSLVAFAKTAGKARAQMAHYLEWDMKDAFKQINRVRRDPDFVLEDDPVAPVVKHPATVKYGSVGSTVRMLQSLLNHEGSKLIVDGVFGPITRTAVREFQKNHNLEVDGIVGPLTWTALGK